MAEEKSVTPNLNQLIKAWVESQAEKVKVKVFDVELDGLDAVLSAPKYQQSPRLEEGNKKIRVVPKIIENHDHTFKHVSGDIEEKVSHTKEHTLTKGLELGFELGAGSIVAFKLTGKGSLSQEKKTSQTHEEILREHYEFDLAGKQSAEIKLEIAEIPKVDQFANFKQGSDSYALSICQRAFTIRRCGLLMSSMRNDARKTHYLDIA